VTTREYHPVHHLPTRIVNPRGAVTLMSYDANGNLTNRVDAWGTPIARTNAWVYDSANRMVRHVDGRGLMTDYEYDSRGFLAREFDPENPARQTKYEHDERGNRTAHIDAMGQVTRFGYDWRDRRVAQTNALDHVSLYTYEQDVLVEVETGRYHAHTGRVVRFHYDERGRRTQTVRVDEAGDEHVWETHTYDGDGNLVATANALGQVTRYEYNARGQRVKVLRPFSATETSDIAYEYDDQGHLVREIDPLGVITAYEYDPIGRQRKITEAVGTELQRSRTSSHDLNGNLISIAYSDGTNTLTTFYDYDLLDRRIAIRGAREYPKQFEYDANNNLLAEVNGRGYRTEHRYDGYNRRTNSVEGIKLPSEPGESTGYHVYNLVDRVMLAVDGNGNHQQFHHDPLGRLIAQSIRLKAAEQSLSKGWWQDRQLILKSTEFNPWGQIIATINWAGGTTSTSYDRFGRVLQTKDEAGLILTHEYSKMDQTVAIHYPVVSTSPEGSPSTAHRYTYSPYNAQQLISTADRGGLVTQHRHDKKFQQTQMVSAWGAITAYRSDALGRQTAITNGQNEVTKSVYNHLNQLVATIRPDHIPETQERIEYAAYDEYGKATNRWGAVAYDIKSVYDLAGNLVMQIDGNNQITRWLFDGRNRKSDRLNPDGSRLSYVYDPANNLTQRKDPRGKVTKYKYDANNSLSEIDYPNDHDVWVETNPLGWRTKMIDGSGTNLWFYNQSGKLMVNNQMNSGYTLRFDYDQEGRRVSLALSQDQGGQEQRTTYNRYHDGRLRNVSDSIVGEYTYIYDERNKVLETHCPNGTVNGNEYDNIGRKLAVWTRSETGVLLSKIRYELDQNGRRVAESSGHWSKSFSFNNRMELTNFSFSSDQGRSVHAEYTYDNGGNRIQSTTTERIGGGTIARTSVSFSVRSGNQYDFATARLEGVDRQFDFTYDENGNMTLGPTADDLRGSPSTQILYDDEDRVTTMVGEIGVIECRYDGMGRRVFRKSLDATGARNVTYVYDGWLAVAEIETGSSGAVTVHNAWGIDISGSEFGEGGVGGLLGFHHSLLGSFSVGYDGNGNIAIEVPVDGGQFYQQTFWPFGGLLESAGSSTSSIFRGYSSKESEPSVGLIYYGKRYYSYGLGRWTSRDPIEEKGGANLYAFVANSPIDNVDFLGEAVYCGGVSGFAGAGVGGSAALLRCQDDCCPKRSGWVLCGGVGAALGASGGLGGSVGCGCLGGGWSCQLTLQGAAGIFGAGASVSSCGLSGGLSLGVGAGVAITLDGCFSF
jgi:RHS repeat-associated protein